jgi:hypothetical protein
MALMNGSVVACISVASSGTHVLDACSCKAAKAFSSAFTVTDLPCNIEPQPNNEILQPSVTYPFDAKLSCQQHETINPFSTISSKEKSFGRSNLVKYLELGFWLVDVP